MVDLSRFTSWIPLTGILDDSFALCMARQQSLTSLLTLMGAYREELEYTVLSNLITVMTSSISFLKIYFDYYFIPDSVPYLPQISYKLARIVADAVPELLDSVKQFFISLFQNSAE